MLTGLIFRHPVALEPLALCPLHEHAGPDETYYPYHL